MAAALGLEPLESEGGLFRRTYDSGAVTAIHYLVVAPDFSALHRLRTSDELFFFHAGAPLRMLVLDGRDDDDENDDRNRESDRNLDSDAGGREEVLGADPLSGQQPSLLVPAGAWQGASSTGGWSLVSTVVAPGFRWPDFELGARSTLTGRFPARAARIAELTR